MESVSFGSTTNLCGFKIVPETITWDFFIHKQSFP